MKIAILGIACTKFGELWDKEGTNTGNNSKDDCINGKNGQTPWKSTVSEFCRYFLAF